MPAFPRVQLPECEKRLSFNLSHQIHVLVHTKPIHRPHRAHQRAGVWPRRVSRKPAARASRLAGEGVAPGSPNHVIGGSGLDEKHETE